MVTRHGEAPEPYRATVLVVGDLGRSPRMLHQALALARSGAEVALVGYTDSPIDPCVREDPRIRIYSLGHSRRAPQNAGKLRFVLESAVRFAWLHVKLLWFLPLRTPRPDVLLVQNPPSVPTLPVAWLVARMRRSRLVVDWHNLGSAMLGVRLGKGHPLVRAMRWLERTLGRRADANLAVSDALRQFLTHEFDIPNAAVLYDAPRLLSPGIPIADRQAAAAALLGPHGIAVPHDTALLVAPTSWSADEDIEMLMEALALWDSVGPQDVRLLVLITGNGPLRSRFEARWRNTLQLRVEWRTGFFPPEVYRQLVGVAHLGLCLHRSASGLDLPLKLSDFFGGRTPVCALDYGGCLRERLIQGRTGATFRDGRELAANLAELLAGYPRRPLPLQTMQQAISDTVTEDWFDGWRQNAAALFPRPVKRAR